MAFIETIPEEDATGAKVLDGLGVEPDAAYSQLDPRLRDALVVGRPIAQSPA